MEFKVEEDEFPIVDLSIQLPKYDIENGSAFLNLSYKGVEGKIYIKRNDKEDDVRNSILRHFSDLLPANSYIGGIYNERQGPMYPLDVIIRLPRAFQKQIFYLYVVHLTPSLQRMIKERVAEAPAAFKLDSILNVDRSSDLYRSQSEILSSIFRKHGYVKCALPAHIFSKYKEAQKMIFDFFNLPEETKKKYSTGQIGYIPKSRREIFHIHESLFAKAENFPDEIGEFHQVMKDVFEYFRDISISVLLSLTLPLGYDEEYILSLIDKSDEFWLYATSFRLFRYNPVAPDANWNHILQCEEHADTSLLTLSPCTIPSEVEMVDRRTGLWQEVEKGANEDEVLIFVGVYLAWLTGGYYLAPLHRVNHTSQEARISTPFFLRSPKNANLKRSYLSSDILPSVPRSEQTIIDFVNARESLLPHLTSELLPYQ